MKEWLELAGWCLLLVVGLLLKLAIEVSVLVALVLMIVMVIRGVL